jgi:rubrerythrin
MKLNDVYVCSVCGFTVEGIPPEKCPVCGAPKDKYEKVK